METPMNTNARWVSVEDAAKKPKKGMIRIYSYAPEYNDYRKNWTHMRYTTTENPFGSRKCDFVIDIPEPPK